MHVLVVGASKGIGLEAVSAALRAGHRVRAFARSADRIALAHANLEKRRGNALQPADIEDALEGIDAVVQTLGVPARDLAAPVTLFSEATRVLVPAMERQGVKRLVAVTGFGAGDSRVAMSWLELGPFRLFLGRAYDDKTVQERIIKESRLDWTILRPGILVPGPASGRCRALVEPAQWRNGFISRAEVADFAVKAVAASQYLRKAPVLVSL